MLAELFPHMPLQHEAEALRICGAIELYPFIGG